MGVGITPEEKPPHSQRTYWMQVFELRHGKQPAETYTFYPDGANGNKTFYLGPI